MHDILPNFVLERFYCIQPLTVNVVMAGIYAYIKCFRLLVYALHTFCTKLAIEHKLFCTVKSSSCIPYEEIMHPVDFQSRVKY